VFKLIINLSVYFRTNGRDTLYYEKLYGDGKRFIQKCETMELTEKAEKLFKTVKNYGVKKDKI